MIDIEKIQSISKEIMDLNLLEVNMLMIDLIRLGKLDFVELAKIYVQTLETSNNNKESSIKCLGLMLAAYCMTDTSTSGS